MQRFNGFTSRYALLTGLVAGVATLTAAPFDAPAYAQGATARNAAAANQIRINRIATEGNSKLKSEQILPEMQLKSRGVFSERMAQEDVQLISEIYRRSGRGAASVSYRLVNLPNGTVDVVYTIDEGSKTGIKSLNFEGNQAYSDSRLRGLMQLTEMNYLSWFKSSDVYDPDRLAADQELIRRYYQRNGYADFRFVSTDVQFDAGQGGYVITMVVDEGPQYRLGNVQVESRLDAIDSASLQRYVSVRQGAVYNGLEIEKSLEAITRDVSRRGYPFAQVRPRGERNPDGTISLSLLVDDGPRVYIERINVRGNTRTRDYVVRREFDVGEGDAYNRVLIDRAERRLNNLGFFKTVRITNEPGSAPDRVIVNVDVEDQSTGSFSVAGGYSTTDGFIAELSLSESNFLGRGQFVRAAIQGGQNSRGVEFSFTEPYFLGNRIAAGFDVFHKQTDSSQYTRYENWVTGATLRLGLPITDEITFSPRYSIYSTRLKIPNVAGDGTLYNDCTTPVPGYTPLANSNPLRVSDPGNFAGNPTASQFVNCLSNGEASLAIKEAQGTRLTSLVGYSLSYNTLDNNRTPTSGIFAELRQDFAGLGGKTKFIRTTADLRYYHELYDNIVGFVRLQGGNITAFGGDKLRIVDNFNLGPSLVRGFAPGGIGPRDISNPLDTNSNPLGGTTYFGGTVEVQFPLFGLPRELGLKGAIFADAGTMFGYRGETNFSTYLGLPANSPCVATNVAPNFSQGNCIVVDDSKKIRSSIGASLLWNSPLGPIRFDYAYALSKADYDVTQVFRFSGGTSF